MSIVFGWYSFKIKSYSTKDLNLVDKEIYHLTTNHIIKIRSLENWYNT